MTSKNWFLGFVGLALFAILLGCAWVQSSPWLQDSAAVSTLVGAVVGAAGALFGSWLVHAQSERSKQREEIFTEIKNTNAAIAIAVNLSVSFLNIKSQHIVKMLENHRKNRSLVQSTLKSIAMAPPPVRLELTHDFENITPIAAPTEMLSTLMMNKLGGFGRQFQAALTLQAYAKMLDESISSRNLMIQEFKGLKLPEPEQSYRVYGIQMKGERDGRYDSTMECLGAYVDSCIFFSVLCCEDLMKHGNRLADKAERDFGSPRPHVSQAIFTKPRDEGLIPPDSEFSAWLSGHVETQKK